MMKKLSFVLALIIACGALAACGGDSDGTTEPKGGSSNPPKQSGSSDSSNTPAKTTQKPSTTKPGTDTTKPAQTTQPKEDEDQPKDELIDGSKFTVDGDLSDWEGLATLKLQGEADTVNKSITFYGAMTTTGLYLACDTYHDIYTYTNDQADWYKSTNFELYISTSSEHFGIYANGPDSFTTVVATTNPTCQITQAFMKTTEIGDATKYHTVAEVFIANEDLPEYAVFSNTVSVGLAWKTLGDLIIGGQYHYNEDGSDEYWVLKGDDASNCPLVATPKGLYWFEDYFAEAE